MWKLKRKHLPSRQNRDNELSTIYYYISRIVLILLCNGTHSYSFIACFCYLQINTITFKYLETSYDKNKSASFSSMFYDKNTDRYCFFNRKDNIQFNNFINQIQNGPKLFAWSEANEKFINTMIIRFPWEINRM